MEETTGLFALYQESTKSYLSVEKAIGKGKHKKIRKYLCVWTTEEKIDQTIVDHGWDEVFEKFEIKFETMLQLCHDMKIGITFDNETKEEKLIEYGSLLLDGKYQIRSTGKPAIVTTDAIEDESVVFIDDDAEFYLIHKMDGDRIVNTLSLELDGDIPCLVIFSEEKYTEAYVKESKERFPGVEFVVGKDNYKNIVYNCLHNKLDILINPDKDPFIYVPAGYTITEETERSITEMMAKELQSLN